MKKTGFTLAEVLVTLGIIGVVAALTTPALVKNSGQAKAGPTLAKFVNTFESGVEQMMHEEGLSTFTTTTSIPVNELSKYIVMVPYEPKEKDGKTTKEHKYTDAQGKNGYTFGKYKMAKEHPCGCKNIEYIDVANVPYQLKDGTLISFQEATKTVDLTDKGSYKKLVGAVLVDINGESGPNKAGKDVFAFIIDQSGTLIPVGGNVHKFIDAVPKLKDIGIISKSATCKSDYYNVAYNFACTGAIADNGWKSTGLD